MNDRQRYVYKDVSKINLSLQLGGKLWLVWSLSVDLSFFIYSKEKDVGRKQV